MIQEAIDALVTLGRKSAPCLVPAPEGEPAGVYYLRTADGSLERKVAAPPKRQHIANGLDPIIDFVERFAVEGSNPSIWYNRLGITAILIDSTRSDRVTLPLDLSPQLLRLIEMQNAPRNRTQKEAVYLLRVDFNDCLDLAPDVLTILRQIDFKSAEQGTSAITHGKSSVGKQLMAEVTGARPIPEDFDLSVPIFKNAFDYRRPVGVAIDIDVPASSFKFVPFPGHIEAALQSAEDMIGARIRARVAELGINVPVYFGTP